MPLDDKNNNPFRLIKKLPVIAQGVEKVINKFSTLKMSTKQLLQAPVKYGNSHLGRVKDRIYPLLDRAARLLKIEYQTG